jgi:osmotically-inducible protein OsmY
MRTTKNIVAGLMISLGVTGVAWASGTAAQPRSIEDQVRHMILSVPYLNVFDNLSYSVENGVVTLSGQVTRPIDKDYVESAVRRVAVVTRIDNQIEVLPLSPFDDRIRLTTLRNLERTTPLGRYFMGVNPSIRIVVKNGNLTLDGVVLNSGDRQVAFMAASSVPGVFTVTNNLRAEK